MSVRKVMRNPTSNLASEPPRKPPRKPLTSTRILTRNLTSNPTSNFTSELPRKLSTSVRKQTCSKQSQFDKNGVRIVGTAIDKNSSVQNVSEAIGNRKIRELTNKRMSSPKSKERAATKAVDR